MARADARRVRQPTVEIAGHKVAAGTRQVIDLALPDLYTKAETRMPITVVNGARAGPRLFVSAAIHGDELNGLEIVRRLLRHPTLARLRGTLIAIPIVNVYGCLTGSRTLPDGRDLNRMFPGAPGGSMASRIAHLFMQEIVLGSDYGIDLHTGSNHRQNLPQIRTSPDLTVTHDMARAFGAPVMIDSNLRDGSLRSAALEAGIPILLYEAGEALRFDEVCIRAGVSGVIGVMRSIGMLPPSRRKKTFSPLLAESSTWVRASASGVFRLHRGLGDLVGEGDPLGEISNPMGSDSVPIVAHRGGLIIGVSRLPLVHEGEAVVHIAQIVKPRGASDVLDAFGEKHDPALPHAGELPIAG